MRRATSVALAALLVATSSVPAGATPPLPNLDKEYWFGNYQIGKVWQLGATGRGVTVAVLDTGVQANRPELRGVVLPGTDLAGGNGHVDTDVPDGHGTSIARYIAGQGGGTANLVGIAPEAKILPVTVNDRNGGLDPVDAFSRGIDYAVAHGAKVINMSQIADGTAIPGHCPPAVATAVRNAVDKGTVVVAGAGNQGNAANYPGYPAACPGVLAVGAVDGSKRAWPRSERQPYVDVAAPGVNMTDVTLRNVVGVSDGTSNSTALVSGALALVWSKFPHLTNRQVVARLLATVTDDATRPGHDDVTGFGIVRPYNAIVDHVSADAPNPVFDELRSVAPSSSPAPTTGRSAGGAGPTVGKRGAATSSSSSPLLLIALIGGGLLAVAVAVAVLVSRRRRPGPLPPPGPYPPGPYPGPYPPGPYPPAP